MTARYRVIPHFTVTKLRYAHTHTHTHTHTRTHGRRNSDLKSVQILSVQSKPVGIQLRRPGETNIIMLFVQSAKGENAESWLHVHIAPEQTAAS